MKKIPSKTRLDPKHKRNRGVNEGVSEIEV